MRRPDAKITERVKDILLVVLFLTTVLLLYFSWENTSNEVFRLGEILPVSGEKAPETGDTVIPQKIAAGFGNGAYTIITEGGKERWKQAVEEIRKLDNSSTVLVKTDITEKEYWEAMNYSSIRFQFGYDIPFQEFCDFYGLTRYQGYELIEGVESISYSEQKKETILIRQKKGNKYFAIVADGDYTNFSNIIAEIEASDSPVYYPAATFFGENIESTALLPLPQSLWSNLNSVTYEKESKDTKSIKVNDLAESFFGESFDFIRKMVDRKGSITYMYGYGKKVFHVYEDGTFEYEEELTNTQGKQTNFYNSLTLVLQFVADHGTWNSLDGTKMSAYLKKVEPIDRDKEKGYQFSFGMKIGANNVFYEKGDPIVVRVINGQVVYYHRDMVDFEEDAATDYLSDEKKDPYDPINLMTVNLEQIYEELEKAGATGLPPLTDQEAAFDAIAGKIHSIEIGYVRTFDEDGTDKMELIPCYKVTFRKDNEKGSAGRNITLYFDLYNAEQIGIDDESSIEINLHPESEG